MTTWDTTTRAIHMNRSLPLPAGKVWQALIDADQVGTWCAAAATVTAERGGSYELFWQPETPELNSTIGCRVTAVAPEHYLAFTWRGPDELSDVMNDGDPPPPPTHVTISLRPADDGGTELDLVHSGFGTTGRWAAAVAWHERAWTVCLDNLEALLADRPLPRPWR
jgi:uncharacterized protein YndB with AHSA1/START domain